MFCGGMIPDHPGWILLDDDVGDGWFTEEEIQTQERMYGGELYIPLLGLSEVWIGILDYYRSDVMGIVVTCCFGVVNAESENVASEKSEAGIEKFEAGVEKIEAVVEKVEADVEKDRAERKRLFSVDEYEKIKAKTLARHAIGSC